ncbi:RICIN domain-containing protein [Amycolatopsis sp. NPDC049253]|uniref:RICIN domain-containing protein n=1 Tax=Amycolatopsis sp. NPDC049253 TaxID=3155274 RepID=UPI00343907CB
MPRRHRQRHRRRHRGPALGLLRRTNQKWSAGANGSLVSAGSGKCLDVEDGSTANGTKLQIWTCSGGPGQRWSVPA